jgi:mycothiol synthase
MPPMKSLDIQKLPASQARQVLRLTMALPGQSPSEIEAQVSTFMNHARVLSLDLGLQWLVSEGDRIVAACSCVESPGRTSVLFLPPFGLRGGTEPALDKLVAHVIAEQSTRNVRLAQCLLNLDDRYNERALLRAGFRPIAELIYMDCLVLNEGPSHVTSSRGHSHPLPALEWESYNSASHLHFVDLILATYRGSLDCPALSGLREIEDILTGHKNSGLFQSHRWRLARIDGRPAGCILLSENPLRRVLEVAYMGVHPDFRGRALGRALVSEGLSIAYREQFEKVTLAVDAANAPARRLYGSAGFVETMRRRAMIVALDSSARNS